MIGKKTTLGQNAGHKTFGKLGNRSAVRLNLTIDGGVATTSQNRSCRVENISATGCRLDMSECASPTPPREGSQVMIKVERAEALGHIAWVDGAHCGVIFAAALPPKKLERLRWIVDHPDQHQQNVAGSAAMNWC